MLAEEIAASWGERGGLLATRALWRWLGGRPLLLMLHGGVQSMLSLSSARYRDLRRLFNSQPPILPLEYCTLVQYLEINVDAPLSVQ